MAWPPETGSDPAYGIIDHRELDEGVVEIVSSFLADDDKITVVDANDEHSLGVTFRGRDHRLPLTGTPHDRCVTLSSLAELLKRRYAFYLLEPDGDSLMIFVAAHEVAKPWGPPPAYLLSYRCGVDYFMGLPGPGNELRIPYLNNPSPDFDTGRNVVANQREAAGAVTDIMLGMLFGGKVDDAKLVAMARAVKDNPKLPASERGKSEEELVAELRAEFGRLAADPEIASAKREMADAMTTFKTDMMAQVVDAAEKAAPPPAPMPPPPPKRPWWKFW